MLYKEGLEFDAALKYLQKAAQADPDDVTIVSNLATTAGRQGSMQLALDHAERTITLMEQSQGRWISTPTVGPRDLMEWCQRLMKTFSYPS